MNLSEYMRSRDADNDAMLRELVDRYGGCRDGETLDEAVKRCRQQQTVYNNSILRLRAAAEALRKQDEELAAKRKVG